MIASTASPRPLAAGDDRGGFGVLRGQPLGRARPQALRACPGGMQPTAYRALGPSDAPRDRAMPKPFGG
jgi:hypothetical protein